MQTQQKLTSILQLHSPGRISSNSTNPKSQAATAATSLFTAAQIPSPTKSQTQHQLLSHPLIKQILQKSKQNTIQHNVNIISTCTQLYNMPLDPITDQLKDVTDSIPSTKDNFYSNQSVKIQEVNGRLSDGRDIAERLDDRLREIADKNREKCEVSRKRRVQSAREANIDRRVSVSGLVSYNFNSVKARRSLGSIPDIPQQLALQKQKQQVRDKNTCSQTRRQSIIHRKPNPYSLQKLQTQKAMATNFTTPTDTFLTYLIHESKTNKQIYGQKFDKLKCIKQYMQEQKVDYQHAQHIVNIIVNSNMKEKPKKEKIVVKKIEDQVLLAKRRRSVQSKRVMLKNLYFVE